MKLKTKLLIAAASSCMLLFVVLLGSMVRSKAATDNSELVKNVSISRNKEELTNNMIIYKDDVLNVRYDLVELLSQGDSANIEKGKTYVLPVPNNLLIASQTVWDATVDNTVLCNCQYNTSTNKIEIVFDDALFNSTSVIDVEKAYIGFYATVDGAGKNVGDPIVLSTPSGLFDDIVINYGGATKPKEVKVSKLGSDFDEKTNTVEWTIKVTEGPDGEDTLIVRDTMSDELEYVEDSFMIDGQSASPIVQGSNLEYTINIDKPFPNKEHVITYKTAVYPIKKLDNEYNVIEARPLKINVENSVNVQATTDGPVLGDAKAAVSCDFDNIKWIEKKYHELKKDPTDEDSRILTWEVTVHAYDYTFENVVIYDTIEAGMVSGSTVSYVPDSFKMEKSDGSPVSVALDGVPTFDQNGTCSWKTTQIPFLDPGDYTITYDVKITNYFNYKYNNTKKMNNTAWAVYDKIRLDGLPGFGPGELPPIKVDADDIGTKMTSLDKRIPHPAYEFDGYQRGAEVHGCPWIITVNADQEKLTSDFYLIETIGGRNDDPTKLKQVVKDANDPTQVIFDLYVDGVKCSQYSNEYKQIKISPVNGDESQIKITLGNLLVDGHKVEFRFQTYLDESEREYFEGQHWYDTDGPRRLAHNTVTLYEGDNVIFPKDAYIDVRTNVLQKEFVNYNYNSQIATWKLLINRDMMNLEGVTVSDKLKSGSLDHIELIIHMPDYHSETQPGAARVTLTENAADNANGVYYTYDEATKEFKIFFGDIEMCQTYTAYIYEKIDPSAIISTEDGDKSLENYNGEITITNEATLTKKHTAPITAKATGVINNKLFDKKAEVVSKGKATYTIFMNQGHMSWPDNAQISDMMSAGLSPDLSSFQMFVANVADDGTMTKGAQVSAADYNVTLQMLSQDSGSDKVETIITLPSNATNEAYIITYDVYIDEGYAASSDISFDNTVTVKGMQNKGTIANETISLSQLLGYGGGTLSYSKVKVCKVDEDGSPLAGAGFDLVYNDVVITSLVTDANGSFEISNLTPGMIYVLKETVVPDGYLEADDTEFTAPEKGSSEMIDNPIVIVDNKIPDDPDDTPDDPDDTPNDPDDTPDDPDDTPDDPDDTPDDPDDTPDDPDDTPDDPDDTPDDPDDTPGDPDDTPDDPDDTPEEPTPTPEEPTVTPEEPTPTPEEPTPTDVSNNTNTATSSDAESDTPKTGDNSGLLMLFVLMLVSGFGFLYKRER